MMLILHHFVSLLNQQISEATTTMQAPSASLRENSVFTSKASLSGKVRNTMVGHVILGVTAPSNEQGTLINIGVRNDALARSGNHQGIAQRTQSLHYRQRNYGPMYRRSQKYPPFFCWSRCGFSSPRVPHDMDCGTRAMTSHYLSHIRHKANFEMPCYG